MRFCYILYIGGENRHNMKFCHQRLDNHLQIFVKKNHKRYTMLKIRRTIS